MAYKAMKQRRAKEMAKRAAKRTPEEEENGLNIWAHNALYKRNERKFIIRDYYLQLFDHLDSFQ